jgi:hypothetical protein
VENGRLLGLLTMEDVSRFLMVEEVRRNSRALGFEYGGGKSPRFTIDLG